MRWSPASVATCVPAVAELQFDLVRLTAQAVDIPACAVNLSPMTIALLFAVTEVMEDSENWRGAGDELTDEEIDTIDAAVALMESEIMTALNLGTMSEQDSDAVDITGGTVDVSTLITDALSVINPTTHSVAELQANGASSGDVVIRLDTATARLRNIQFRTNHLNRFNIVVTDAETGSNAGSNLKIQTYPDAGTPATTVLQVGRSNGKIDINNDLQIHGNVGFYNTTPATKPTVTGSRGGNAALASLLTALASLGLITNSTS